jgi:hypothetical protein
MPGSGGAAGLPAGPRATAQRVGHGIEHAVGEMAGEGVQLAALGHQFGLLLRIARAIGVVQQRLLQRFDGQDQGAASVCRHRPIKRPAAHAPAVAGRWRPGGLVGRGDGKDS